MTDHYDKAIDKLAEMASEGYEPESHSELSEEDQNIMRGADIFFEMLGRMENDE